MNINEILDEIWEGHWVSKTPRNFSSQDELADFEKEHERKIWDRAQLELLKELSQIESTHSFEESTAELVYDTIKDKLKELEK